MEFRTTIEPLRCRGLISHETPVMMLGSCFTQNVGSRLQMAMFDVKINPFGALYNPLTIAELLQRVVDFRRFEHCEFFEHGGIFNHFSAHSSLSGKDLHTVSERLNGRLEEAHEFAGRCRVWCITLGTSYVYYHDGVAVGNCHKLPSSYFDRRMLTVDEATEALGRIHGLIKDIDRGSRLIVTISPIRHLADGLAGNSVSKAVLRLAAERLCSTTDAVYFPSYEIMLDDLRDYRFYSSDMKHPSDVAVEYIYEIFRESFFDRATIQAASEAEKVSKRLLHRPITGNDEALSRFMADTRNALDELLKKYPGMKVPGDI